MKRRWLFNAHRSDYNQHDRCWFSLKAPPLPPIASSEIDICSLLSGEVCAASFLPRCARPNRIGLEGELLIQLARELEPSTRCLRRALGAFGAEKLRHALIGPSSGVLHASKAFTDTASDPFTGSGCFVQRGLPVCSIPPLVLNRTALGLGDATMPSNGGGRGHHLERLQ